jgi:hypothetical protein
MPQTQQFLTYHERNLNSAPNPNLPQSDNCHQSTGAVLELPRAPLYKFETGQIESTVSPIVVFMRSHGDVLLSVRFLATGVQVTMLSENFPQTFSVNLLHTFIFH